jgi:hypothetical protein
MALSLAIYLARLEGERSWRKDSLTALRIRLVSYCRLLPVRLKFVDMDPKCYSAAYWCIVRFGRYDHLCNPFYLLLMAVTMIPITLCESQQWSWDCDGLHNGHFEFIINSWVLQANKRGPRSAMSANMTCHHDSDHMWYTNSYLMTVKW